MRYLLSAFLLIGIAHFNYSQTSALSLSLDEAENLFLKNNLLLLAQQYNINSKEALVIQAKAYPNPYFTADVNVLDPQNNKVFHIDSSGQKSFQIQQLILLGGKRKLEIEIAKKNKSIAEAEFSELLRGLKMQLQKVFFSLNEHKIVIENYNKQLNILDTIINSYKLQVEKGNIPLKDLIRLKSVYIRLNNNKSDVAANYAEEEKTIKLLLQINKDVIPVIPETYFQKYNVLKSLEDLQNQANSNRPDLIIMDESALSAALNLKLQKRQSIPDISLNASYDQRGGAFKNQVNAGLGIPIPVFNTNRGNIKAARYEKQSMELYLQEKKLEIELDVQKAWQNMQRSIAEYNKVKTMYNEDFNLVNTGVNSNFLKNNISILEFVDFVEAYNESLAEFEKIKTQLAVSAAEINYVTATKIY